jgi:hypothetical protein
VNFKIQNVRIKDRLACYHGIQMYRNFPLAINTVLRMRLTYTGTKANLHWYKCALVQVFKCERQIMALCHQLFKHCIQLSSVTVTTHDIRDVQTELPQS